MPHKFIIYIILLVGAVSIACASGGEPSDDGEENGSDGVKVGVSWTPLGVPLTLKVSTDGKISIHAAKGILTPIGRFKVSVDPSGLFNTKPIDVAAKTEPSNPTQESENPQKRAEDLKKVITVKERQGVQDKRVIIVRVDDQVTIFEIESGEKFNIEFESEDAPYKRVNFQEVGEKGDILIELESIKFNCLIPDACLNFPEANSQVNGVVEIQGTATRFNFDYYKIEYRPEYSNTDWSYLGGGEEPVIDGVLYQWDTSQVPSGSYTLRLIVVDQSGNFWQEIPNLRIFVGEPSPAENLSEDNNEVPLEPSLQNDLAIGESATVTNTNGQGLNCRLEPAVSAKEIWEFPDGSVVAILGGPVSQDGYNWWQVEDPEQTPCWVAGDWLFK